MKITVILCTYNRCQLLRKALDGITASTLPDSVEWEVLVVDNNSSDHTREVVEDFCKRYPGHVRYLFERQPGKSHALSAGIRDARGDVLAFTDDDVTFEPTWLHNLTSPLRNGKYAGVGGRILLQYPNSPPAWLPHEGPDERLPFPSFDFGPEARELTEPLFGASMAFRKEVFDKYGLFRTDLGPSPNSDTPDCNEDVEFTNRLIAAGEKLYYEPSAVVYHPIPENRLHKQYFLKWWFDKGRADIRAVGVEPGTKYYIEGVPLYLCRRLAVWILRWMVALKPSRRFSCKLRAWTIAGKILECYRRSGRVYQLAEK